MTDKLGKVILIEDNPRHARLIQGMVKEITEPQFELIRVQCLAKAIEHLNKAAFDVVLLDLDLPDSQGLDTFNTMQSRAPNVPIVVIGDKYKEAMALKVVRKGAQDYLVMKQIDSNVLTRVIRYAIERKRKGAGLREVGQVFNGILSSVPIALIRTDEDGICTQSLGSAFRKWGLEDNQLVGVSVFETYPKAKNKIKTALSGSEVQFVDEGIYKNKPIYFRNHFFPDKVAGKGLIGVSIEITDLKLAEKELKKQRDHLEELVKERTGELRDAQEQLIRKEKLAILGQLAGGVGHELRNPLGAMKSAVYFLKMALEKPDPEIKESLEMLDTEVKASETIIKSLLDFARPGIPVKMEVNINGVVEQALSRVEVPEEVHVSTQLNPDLPLNPVDSDQMVRVFENLIRNAIEAMPEGGDLSITTEPRGDGKVLISMEDTGGGIPKEDLEKVFEPLYTKKAKGIGLGLALSKILVEGNGGNIEAESVTGKGSKFIVILPTEVEGKQNKSE